MAILINKNTRVVIQGITGREGAFHTERMLNYGTNIVAGVTPNKGGSKVNNIPVFDTVEQAKEETGCNTSCIFVPAPLAADAILEAIAADMKVIVCITEGIPVLDMIEIKSILNEKKTTVLIGPNCPGIINPIDCVKVGLIPNEITKPGKIGIISRSGTLTYEVIFRLTNKGLGQSTCVGIGGDPILGSSFVDILSLFAADEETEKVILIGEIGGNYEEAAALFIKNGNIKKEVVAFISGQTAPEGKRMGHAGAIIQGNIGTAENKIKALKEAGVKVANSVANLIELVAT